MHNTNFCYYYYFYYCCFFSFSVVQVTWEAEIKGQKETAKEEKNYKRELVT